MTALNLQTTSFLEDLLALVFIGMMLRKEQDKQERIKKETRKTKGRLQVSTEKKNIEITILYDA